MIVLKRAKKQSAPGVSWEAEITRSQRNFLFFSTFSKLILWLQWKETPVNLSELGNFHIIILASFQQKLHLRHNRSLQKHKRCYYRFVSKQLQD